MATVVSKPEDPGAGLRYGESVSFVFDSPNWVMNLVYGGLCFLVSYVIPVVGQLVWMGYVFEIIERLHRGNSEPYHDFDTDRIIDYLSRGAWVFLIGLIASMVMAPIFGILMFGGFLLVAGAAGAGGEDVAVPTAFGLVVVAVPVILAVTILLTMVVAPFYLRAGLSQKFSESFDLDFAKDFISKVWKEMLMAGLFSMAVAIAAYIVGILALCIGALPAVAFTMMVQAHLGWQLYELYLARGGREIPLSETRPAT